MSNAVTVFGDHAFQRWQPEREVWRNQVLASLYDAEMLALQEINIQLLSEKKKAILAGFQQLFDEPEFLRSVNAATNTPSFLKYRVRRVRELISGILQQ